jgi:hypothetical protein
MEFPQRKGKSHMKKMSRYCKAYPVEQFRAYPKWNELVGNNMPDQPAGAEQEYFFLHDNLVVTRDVFVDEQVVFDAITEEWKQFCATTLEFKILEEVAAMAREA